MSAGKAFCIVLLMLTAPGCWTSHRIKSRHEIEVKPMHITIDVNIKIDNALDDFFGDLDEAAQE